MFDFKFDWCKEMEVGIERVDSQHRELFRIGREIEQLLIQDCKGANSKQLLDIVCELREYVCYHFYEEEKLMKACCYTGYEEHKKMHDDFTKDMLRVDVKALGRDPKTVLSELKVNLQNWLFSHILVEDYKMCQMIKEKALLLC